MRLINVRGNRRPENGIAWVPAWQFADKYVGKTRVASSGDGTTPQSPAVPEPVPSNVLIVDDDAKSRLALHDLLDAPGRNTIVAASGEDALRCVLKQDFAVILLDVQMPRLDGFETAKLMRERERSRHTPIIFLTGAHDDLKSVFRGYEAGAVDYIIKPPNPDVLRSKVSVFVDLYTKNALLRQEVAERKLAEAQLRTSEENLRALAAHLQSVREEERTRISREIHDQLGQELTGLKIEVNWIATRLPDGNKALVTRAHSALHLIDDIVQSVRRIAAGLRPAISDQLGLAAAIEWQTKDFRKRTGIRCKLALPADMPALDQEGATAMYRVFQELLTNVARHAEASRVEVTMEVDGEILVLSVEDNGKGIGKASLFGANALGFLGMRERLRPLGGNIEVDETREKGTKVSAYIPIGSERTASRRPPPEDVYV